MALFDITDKPKGQMRLFAVATQESGFRSAVGYAGKTRQRVIGTAGGAEGIRTPDLFSAIVALVTFPVVTRLYSPTQNALLHNAFSPIVALESTPA